MCQRVKRQKYSVAPGSITVKLTEATVHYLGISLVHLLTLDVLVESIRGGERRRTVDTTKHVTEKSNPMGAGRGCLDANHSNGSRAVEEDYKSAYMPISPSTGCAS